MFTRRLKAGAHLLRSWAWLSVLALSCTAGAVTAWAFLVKPGQHEQAVRVTEASEQVEDRFPEWSWDDKAIIFTRDVWEPLREGLVPHPQMALVSAEGGEPRTWTQFGEIAVTADGKYVWCWQPVDPAAGLQLYDVAKDAFQQVVPRLSSLPIASETGARVVLADRGKRPVFYDLESGTQQTLPLTSVLAAGWSRDGSRAIMVEGLAKGMRLWAVDEGKEPVALGELSGGGYGAACCSPDGRWAAMVEELRVNEPQGVAFNLIRADLAANTLLPLLRLPNRPGSAPIFSPDSETILLALYVGMDVHLFSLTPEGTELTRLTPAEPGGEQVQYAYPRWSPDGKAIGCVRAYPDRQREVLPPWDSELVVVPREGGSERLLLQDVMWDYPAWSHDGSRLAVARQDGIYIVSVSSLQH